jgi:FAD/FMN-containing dehydrogenase
MTMQPQYAFETGPTRALGTLRREFAGPVHLPGDEEYDEQRRAFNPRLDSRPAVVAEALTPADVQAAVRVARDGDLPFAVQSTGHGTSVAMQDGLLLKTGRMAQVLVDPQRRIARVGPGARWSDVIAAAEPFGLAPLSGDTPSVGVAGYTLGGGYSWLSRCYGFAADSLLRADVVTADGRLRTTSRTEHPDLFWAMRGGGGNFGVVTSLEVRLFPAGRVHGGVAHYPIERAGDLLAHLAEGAGTRPDELTLGVVLFRSSPVDGVDGPSVAVRGVYAGSGAEARLALRPLRTVAGPALAGGFRTMRYADTSTIGGTPPRRFELYDDLSPAVRDEMVAAVTRDDGGVNALEVRQWGGAMATPTRPDPGPVSHRDAAFAVKMDATHEATEELAAHATGGSFLNFLHDTTQTHTAYTPPDLQRLRELKWAWDPDSLFRPAHHIAPCP